MWLAKFLTIVAAVCVSVCSSASLPEVAVEKSAARFGNLNTYHLYTWEHALSETEEVVANDATEIAELSLTGNERVTIVVHGRESGVRSEFGETLKTSLVQADKEMVVILVDWSIIASLNYDQVVLLVPSIADDLVTFITNMVNGDKLDTSTLHLIGFDVGAHIVGIASRRNAIVRAKKITALSPAGGDMYLQRLRATDAQFVETINTDSVGNRAFGISVADRIGALDFFPNGGTRQPGCANSDNWCHHNRAWQLFAATVDMGGHLTGSRCDTPAQLNNNRCEGSPRSVLGSLQVEKLPLAGLYRVNTGRTYPY